MKIFESNFSKLLLCLATCLPVIISCVDERKNRQEDTSLADTVRVIQTVLYDKKFESRLTKYFQGQSLTLVENGIIKRNSLYKFADRPVKIVSVNGDLYELHERFTGRFFMSVSTVRFFDKDSATVFAILHAGNSTFSFKLKKEGQNWVIRSHEYGKF